MWVRSWQTPRPSPRAWAAVVAVPVGPVSKDTVWWIAPIRACRRSSGSARAPAESSAKALRASSGSVRAVVRRNTSGWNRSTEALTTPLVSQVSTSPVTDTTSWETGPGM